MVTATRFTLQSASYKLCWHKSNVNNNRLYLLINSFLSLFRDNNLPTQSMSKLTDTFVKFFENIWDVSITHFLLQTAKEGLKFFNITLSFQCVLYFLLLQQNGESSCLAIHFEAYLLVYFEFWMLFEALIGSICCVESYKHCLRHNFKKGSQEK